MKKELVLWRVVYALCFVVLAIYFVLFLYIQFT